MTRGSDQRTERRPDIQKQRQQYTVIIMEMTTVIIGNGFFLNIEMIVSKVGFYVYLATIF